ncbi:NADP-dependent oxidoreductase [Aeromonas sp. FDAARGOS 1409]|uniref:NADP-dependent oxidoreductase n=1 Tax=Aeromonas TaxID=642 RepID=UPI001C221B56|nr:NADP-dependent oxidoreductase [Aeromonas sp. FDAARGOS 1409]QXC31974.1 NADP-dependent oxidoreductase [Aeromonas sp. FDAARGOS 1409]
MNAISHQIQLLRRPTGLPTPDDFALREVPLPALQEGEVLVTNQWLSVDPYMRGRMSEAKSYVPPFPLNGPLDGGAIGVVEASRHPDFAVGDRVSSMQGWRDRFVANGAQLTRLPDTRLPPQLFLGALGMPGMTAWAGLHKVARLQAGETLLVSAASGAVGTMAVQLAKQAGARVIGSTGSADKVAYLKTLGADAVINYRETPDLDAELARLAPEGIHVYFENVGGAMLDAALNHMALHGRIVLCGLIAQYNGQGSGPRNLAQVIRKRILIQGLLVSDHWQYYGEFLAEAIPAFEAGALQAEETVSTGLASMPQAFIGLFEGHNTGKMLVKLD